MTLPLWQQLTFLSPVSEQRAETHVAWLAEGLGAGTVADVGCGWAELLLRVVARAPRARGLGVDLDADRVEHARTVATERGLRDRVELVAGAGVEHLPERVEALVAVGASQVWGATPEVGPNDAYDQPLDYTAALRALRRAAPRGGRVYYAEAVWSRPPTPEAVAPLGGRDDELVALPELLDLAKEAGFGVLGFGESTLQEWDDFESGFAAGHAAWLAAHEPDHPEAAAVRQRADRQHAAYLRGYRGVLGFAHLRLVAL